MNVDENILAENSNKIEIFGVDSIVAESEDEADDSSDVRDRDVIKFYQKAVKVTADASQRNINYHS